MNNEKDITRGGLSGKMGGYQPDPPESVWEGVASGLRGKRSGRKLFLFLGAAAGLALAITVGITLLNDTVQPDMARIDETSSGKPGGAPTEELLNGEVDPNGGTVPPAAGEEQSTGESGTGESTGIESAGGADTRQPGKVSRLEQKVITAMQDVMEEQQPDGEEIAGMTPSEQTGTGPAETSGDGSDQAGSDQDTAGQTGIDSRANEVAASQQAAEDQSGNDRAGNGQGATDQVGAGETDEGDREDAGRTGDDQQQAGNGREVVNEDSLVRLLEGDVPDIAGEELTQTQERKPGKWQLGATVSPLISYRDVASANAAQNVAVNNSESAKLTYAGGLGVSYLPTDRLTIQTGVYYNKMGVNIGNYSSFKSGWFESDMDMVSAPGRSESVVSISNSMGTVISGDEERFVNNYTGAGTLTDYHLLTPEEMIVADAAVESFSQTFEYMEIPFNVRYKILDRTIDLQLMGGFSTNLLVNNSVAAIAGDQTVAIGKVQDIKMFNYSGNAGLGVVYDIFENFSLSIEPRFRYYLNSINTDNLPVTRPYSFGFYTGVNYKF